MKIKNPVFIFARGGSKGIKNKNIVKLNKKPLIFYTIQFALNYKKFDKIYVSTEDLKIKKLVSKFPKIEIINRPKKLALDNSPEILSWKHALNYLNKQNIELDKMIILPVTSPFRLNKDIDVALSYLVNNVDLVVSVCKANKNPEFNMLKKEGKYLKLYNKPKKNIFRRQDAQIIFDMTTLFYIIKTKYLKKTKRLLNGKTVGVQIPKLRAIDIDNYIDLKFAEFLIKKNK